MKFEDPGAQGAMAQPHRIGQTLRLAINTLCLWRPLTGIGQYTLNLARSWPAEEGFEREYFYGSDWSTLAAARDAPGLASTKKLIRRFLPRPYEISRALMQRRFNRNPRKFDVYHEPNFLPFRFDGPTVLTVHDLSYVRYAGTHPAERVRIMGKLLPPAVERAAHILTDSYFQREEIISYFGVAPDRVTACHLGVSSDFCPRTQEQCAPILAQHGITFGRYYLAVGTLEPRKNLAAVLEAYAKLPESVQHGVPLVIAGMRGWNIEELSPRLRKLARAGSVRVLGFVSEVELPSIYSGALGMLYPSLYEGFGLPVVEAMASGVPVLVSNRSSLPEVAGVAGVQVEPDDVAAMSTWMERLIDDQAFRLVASHAGLAQAQRFTWEACAATTADVIARAARL